MRKILCLEQQKKGFENITLEELKKLAGYYMPDDCHWEVNLLEEDAGYTVKTQFEAEVIANQEMIKGMLMLLLKKK